MTKLPYHHLRTSDVAKYYRIWRAENPEKAKANRDKFNASAKFSQWRLNNKLKHIKALGGKCQKCGYDKCVAALDIHELNGKVISKNTAFSLTPNVDYSKVVLLCANCHRELHYEENGRKGKAGFLVTTDYADRRAFLIEGRSVKVEAQREGGTASNLSARVKYAKIP
jgi:hypothetical protein